MNIQNSTHNSVNSILEFRKLVGVILNNIWYILALMILSLSVAFTYLRYSTSQYEVGATVLVNDSNNGPGSNLSSFLGGDDIGGLFGSKANLPNEISILKSYSLVNKAINGLGLGVQSFVKGTVKDTEVYGMDSPYLLRVDSSHKQFTTAVVEVALNEDDSYGYTIKGQTINSPSLSVNLMLNKETELKGKGKLGEWSEGEYYRFKIEPNPDYISTIIGETDPPRSFIFKLFSRDRLVEAYRERLNINVTDQQSTVLNIHIRSVTPQKDIDFLNSLINSYLERELEDKVRLADNALKFLDQQLQSIKDSLQFIENQLELYRSSNTPIDLSLVADKAISKIQDLDKKLSEAQIAKKYYTYLLEQLSDSEALDAIVVPSSIGIPDPLLNELTVKLQELQGERANIEPFVTENSQELQVINAQIQSLKEVILSNVKSSLRSLNQSIASIKMQKQEVSREIKSIPKNERGLLRIQRKFDLSSNLYKYLLEKKAEAGITKASTTVDNKIIDNARLLDLQPISPRKTRVYAVALILALLISIVWIYIRIVLQNKVEDTEQISNLIPNITILGSVPKSKKISFDSGPKSTTAESFRAIKTNLGFLDIGTQNSSTCIGFTSTVSGEGKTYCAYNLALALSRSGQKVLVIGGDLRKPKLQEFFSVTSNQVPGLSNVLIGQSDWRDIIHKNDIGIYYLLSGPIPPNPAELLENDKFERLLNEVREEFDWIVIDGPPVGLVSEYYSIGKVMDINIYVVRHGYSKIHFLNNLKQIYEEKSMKSFGVIFNGVPRNGSSYGYGYGYGGGYGYYDEDENKTMPWWRRILQRR